MNLQLKDLSLTLSKQQILKNINLQIADGEMVALLGPSGCGKTSLLNTIAGLIEVESGEIIFNNKVVNTLPAHKRQAVIVFQDFRLFPHMTLGENVAFPLKMSGISKTLIKEKVKDLLERVKLSGFENRSIEDISGGQKQRVAIARALAADPHLLLLDEPFSSLDVNLRTEMQDLIREIQAEDQITTILVTHDKEEALSMADRIAFMNDGEILQYASPETIYNQPASSLIADYFLEGVYLKGNIDRKIFSTETFSFKNELDLEPGNYSCLVTPAAVKIERKSCDSSTSFKIWEKFYQGDRYFLKLQDPAKQIELHCFIEEQEDYQLGDLVQVSFREDKCHFFKRQ